jgi:hypothetical protein
MKNTLLFGLVILFTILSCTNSAQTTMKSAERKKMSDDSLLTLVERQTFKYFWDRAEPVSGMACERVNTDDVYPMDDKSMVTTGGSGFGFMAILVGIERGFITREEGVARFEKVTSFLKKADRFHGVWPHMLWGETGKVRPFSTKDDGADLVETSYMMQGLLCVRQYFKDGNPREKALAAEIDKLWKEVDYQWFTQGKDVIYWHWSPKYNWEMNFPVEGFNECLILYILGASSPTHPVQAAAYHKGWARSGAINGKTTKYGYTLNLKHNGAPDYGGPLFWAHYSYLGLDPRNLKDDYANYWDENKNQTLINRQWCIENLKKYKGYGENCWGLTASYSIDFYAAHAPGMNNDLGVITPTAALSSFPYTPEYSLQALKHFYYDLGDKIWGEYGFYDAFSEQANWYPKQYLAIDQGPEIVMIENYRSRLLWNLFMSCPEIKQGLKKLDFTSPAIDR